MSTVESILMQKGSDVIAVPSSTTVYEAAIKMKEANVSCLLIQDGEGVDGIFTERDMIRRIVAGAKNPATTTLGEVMSSPVKTCKPQDNVDICFDQLQAGAVRHLAVVDGEEPVGVISLRDIALVLRGSIAI